MFAGLGILLLVFIMLLRWKQRLRKNMGNQRLVDILTASHSSRLFTVKFVILLVALAAGIIAVMNPRRPGGQENVSRKGIDIAIILDVSKSMLAADLAPSRLERARQFIVRLMDQLPNDRFALVLFAGKAYIQMPLTNDHGAAGMYVNAASPDAIPVQGTVLSDALNTGANVFNNEEKRFKTMVLISDGEDHDDNAVRTAEDLAARGVLINTVGAGSAEGAVIIDPATGSEKKDEAGNTVVSRLNETTLREVAAATNGIYLPLQGSDETASLLKAQLAQIDRKAYGDVSLMSFKTYYGWFAGIMFLLLLLENLVPEIKRRRSIQNKEAR